MGKYSKFLCFFIAFCITACSVATPPTPLPNSLLPTQSSQSLSKSVIYGTLTGNEQFPAMFMVDSGETIVVIGEPGTTDRIKGFIYIAPNMPTMVVYVNEKGLPDTGIVGDHILLFSNYTNSTVDVTVINPDGSTSENPGVEYNNEFIGYSADPKGNVFSNISYKANNTVKDLKWYLKLVGIAFATFICVKLLILAMPAGLACGGLLWKVAQEFLKESNPELVQPLEKIDKATSTAQCAYGMRDGDLSECVDVVLDTASSSITETNQTIVKQNRVIEEIKLKSSSSPVGNALSCSDTRLTPEEQANCGERQYSLELTSKEGNCDTGQFRSGVRENILIFNFFQDGLEMVNTGAGYSFNFEKLSSNSYRVLVPETGTVSSYLFIMNGFTYVTEFSNGCKTHGIATLK